MHYDLSLSVEHNLSSFVEQIRNKVSLKIMHFDLSLSVEKIGDNIFCTMMPFDLSSSVEQTCDDWAFIYVPTGEDKSKGIIVQKMLSYLYIPKIGMYR